jgi:hypothetical protein
VTIHGYIKCDACKDLFCKKDKDKHFEVWGEGEEIRLINNPAQWGANKPLYRLLGFSKGKTQNEAMVKSKAGMLAFEDVPFSGTIFRRRLNLLLNTLELKDKKIPIDTIFQSTEPNFQCSSLIKCSISALKDGKYSYKLADIMNNDISSGGKVTEIMRRCTRQHLKDDVQGQSFILLGLDKKLIDSSKKIFEEIFGPLDSPKKKTCIYRTSMNSWVHVAHPSAKLTDPQYKDWCAGVNKTPKISWAYDELSNRKRVNLR